MSHDNISIPNVLLDKSVCTTTTITVYMAIAMHADNRTGEARPSIARLARVAGVTERTVQKHINTLIDLGVVTREARYNKDGQSSNLYRVTPPSLIAGGGVSGDTQNLQQQLLVTDAGVAYSGVPEDTPPPVTDEPHPDLPPAQPFPELWLRRVLPNVTREDAVEWRDCWTGACAAATFVDPLDHLTLYLAKKRNFNKPARPWEWLVWFTQDEAKAKVEAMRPSQDEKVERQWWMVEGDY